MIIYHCFKCFTKLYRYVKNNQIFRHNYIHLIRLLTLFPIIQECFNELVMRLDNITEILYDILHLYYTESLTYWKDNPLFRQFKKLEDDVYHVRKTILPEEPTSIMSESFLKYINLNPLNMTEVYAILVSLYRNIIAIQKYIIYQVPIIKSTIETPIAKQVNKSASHMSNKANSPISTADEKPLPHLC